MNKRKYTLVVMLMLMTTFILGSCGNPYSDVKFDEYIKVGKYKGIELEKIDTSVSDEEVDKQIEEILKTHSTSKNVKEGVVKDGDSINIDYVGSIDGETFSGGEEKGRDLVIGSNTFIPGFESSLIGVRVGTTQNIKVKFPDDYSEKSLAGKNAIFAVTVNSKKEYKTPDLDEKFVKANSKFNSVKKYKESVRKDLVKEKERAAKEEYRQKAWEFIISETQIKKDKKGKEKYPKEQLDKFMEETIKTYEDKAKQENLSLGDYVSKYFQLEEKKFREEITVYAKTQIKMDMVMYYIAEKEKLEVSSKEYDDFIEETLSKFGYTEKSFEEANNGKSYETIVGKEKIEEEALKIKVLDFIVSKAKKK